MHCYQPFLVLDAHVIWCLRNFWVLNLAHITTHCPFSFSSYICLLFIISRKLFCCWNTSQISSNRKQAFYRNLRALLQTFLFDFLDGGPTVTEGDHFCHSISSPLPSHSIPFHFYSQFSSFSQITYRLHLIIDKYYTSAMLQCICNCLLVKELQLSTHKFYFTSA